MRHSRQRIPSFSLYGEAAAPQTEGVHIEDIPARSRKYLWKIGTHRHTVLSQCVMVTAGPVTATLDDTRAEFTGPAVIIVPAGTVHSFRFRADTRGYVLTVDLEHVLGLATEVHRAPIVGLFAVPRALDLHQELLLAERVELQFEQLAAEFKQPASWASPVGGWQACCILWNLAHAVAAQGALQPRGGAHAERLREFRHLIEAHYLEHWPVSRYARALALSETRLNRLCGLCTGLTAFAMIQQRLSLEARRRLVYESTSVGSIASELGFEDPAYFSRFFRRHNGTGPSEFRQRHRGG